MLKRFAILVSALALFVLQSQSALACGGLVAPNGAVRLSRAATLVAWHDGIEHYMTSFTYQGDVSNLGRSVTSPANTIEYKGSALLFQGIGSSSTQSTSRFHHTIATLRRPFQG